jgi:hypothetical protein
VKGALGGPHATQRELREEMIPFPFADNDLLNATASRTRYERVRVKAEQDYLSCFSPLIASQCGRPGHANGRVRSDRPARILP